MNNVAFISALDNIELYKEKIGGVPLILKACLNLNKVLPKEKIFVLSADMELLDIVYSNGFNNYTVLCQNHNISSIIYELLISEFAPDELDSYIVYKPEMLFISEDTFRSALKLSKENRGKEIFVFGSWDKNIIDLHTRLSENIGGERIGRLVRQSCFTIATEGVYLSNTLQLLKKEEISLEEIEFIELNSIESMCFKSKSDLNLLKEIDKQLATGKYKNQTYRAEVLKSKVLNCELIICDVDGVLTDGKMIYTEKGDELRNFNVKDGLAANMLKERGLKLAILSSGTNTETVTKRGNKLNFDVISVEEGDKLARFNIIIEKLGVESDRVLYIGDDINDLQVVKQAGVSVCPSDANKSILNEVDWILESKGGDGCLREVADYILEWSRN